MRVREHASAYSLAAASLWKAGRSARWAAWRAMSSLSVSFWGMILRSYEHFSWNLFLFDASLPPDAIGDYGSANLHPRAERHAFRPRDPRWLLFSFDDFALGCGGAISCFGLGSNLPCWVPDRVKTQEVAAEGSRERGRAFSGRAKLKRPAARGRGSGLRQGLRCGVLMPPGAGAGTAHARKRPWPVLTLHGGFEFEVRASQQADDAESAS